MGSESSQKPDPPQDESFAARLKRKYGEGVDPEVSLGGGVAEAPSGATSELLKRLAEHGVKAPRYKLEGEVARGGMGVILKIWDEDLRRHLAMKVVLGRGDAPGSGLTPQLDTKVLARFLEEAQVTGQLDHPGIVPVHELGLDADGRVYFTMKLVKGRDLKAVFDLVFQEKEGWNETRALGVILKACEAMAYAHKKGVIHRDLKPANVMVGSFGEVFVMDWGLARVLGRKDTHDIRLAPMQGLSTSSVKTERREEREDAPDSPLVTMDGDVMGTPAYMPPEQARGEVEKLSARSDVYSIGAMLYHLLARQMPYVSPGARVSNRTVLGMVLQGPPKALFEIRKDLPAELVAICEKAMAREAERRYADTLALAEDLRAYIENRVVGAYETGAWAETKKWVRRNKLLAASVLTLVVVLAIGLLITTGLMKHAEMLTLQANSSRAEAWSLEQVATKTASEVLSLSAIQELKDLEVEADTLWPADPEHIHAYEKWIAEAKLLVEGRAKDDGPGRPRHPSLKDHQATLVEIRKRSKLGREKARLLWFRRMLGEQPWPDGEVELNRLRTAGFPGDPESLATTAWSYAYPDQANTVYGDESTALVMARRALERATPMARGYYREVLAWALFRTGRFDEAKAEEREAIATAFDPTHLEARRPELERAISQWIGDHERQERIDEAANLSSAVDEMQQAADQQGTYEFDDTKDRWWHAELVQLVNDLREFTGEEQGGLFSGGVSERHGWGIPKRAEFARTIQERSLDGTQSKQLWGESVAAIAASPKYGGLKLEPQLGLLPIGADPESGLWEFAHLASGEPAERGADGRLMLKESMGLVFVLIPGGTFRMGAQSTDPTAPNYDPQAGSDESPVHEVKLSPYFLSKYEMTQGQWARFAGRNPSHYTASVWSKTWNREGKEWSALLPVEEVSWTQCMDVMSRLGLSLPSEAQWENGARGGTDSVFWTGPDLASLKDAANLSDAYGKSHGNENWSVWEKDFDDGNSAIAEIGSYRANPFGLHDVHGNVFEWCSDGYKTYGGSPSIDPDAPWTGASLRVNRGGGFSGGASSARSAFRFFDTPDHQYDVLGLRPARALQLAPPAAHPAGK